MSALQPHRKRYWLTPPPDDPTELAEQIGTVCEVYGATPTLAAAGAHVMSSDEMTGIPANILFDQDHTLYLSDFGIVTWLGERPGYDGHLMGTPHYISPKILEGYVDERSEVYSVGILLYQMLTGYEAFDGESDWKICLHHWETQPLAPSLLNPSLPRRLSA